MIVIDAKRAHPAPDDARFGLLADRAHAVLSGQDPRVLLGWKPVQVEIVSGLPLLVTDFWIGATGPPPCTGRPRLLARSLGIASPTLGRRLGLVARVTAHPPLAPGELRRTPLRVGLPLHTLSHAMSLPRTDESLQHVAEADQRDAEPRPGRKGLLVELLAAHGEGQEAG